MKGIVGFCGPAVRGDCRVTAFHQPTPSVEIQSRVLSLYGAAIRAQAEEVLDACGARQFSLVVEDEGALPFTIGARIEAALRQADGSLAASWLPPQIEYAKGAGERSRRTRLYLPGNTPKFFINAGLYGADAVILDLEDSVPPAEKAAARILVRNALRAVDFMGAERIVRINAGPEGELDLAALVGHGVETVIVPKAESAEEILRVDDLAAGQVWILPLIETAKGVVKCAEIASACPRVVALSVGLEDFLADIGAKPSVSGEETLWALSQIVTVARAAGMPALGPMFASFDDEHGLAAQVQRLAGIGFEGFSCIHPMQVSLVHQALMPSADEVERAERVLSGYRAALAEGKGAVAIDGKMVDAPVARRAERTLRQAGRSV